MPAWRLIQQGHSEPAYNMALDAALAELYKGRTSGPPTLRLYGWSTYALTLGCLQKSSDVEREYCESRSIPIVRRPTGGRAILHGAELTYSFSASTLGDGPFSRGLHESYAALSRAFELALRSLGLSVEAVGSRLPASGLRTPRCFNAPSYAELTLGGKKVIGSAQRRWPGRMLQQGSIPLLDEGRAEHEAGVFKGQAPNWHGLEVSEAALREAVVAGFILAFGEEFHEEAPHPREEALAAELRQRKYIQESWTFRK